MAGRVGPISATNKRTIDHFFSSNAFFSRARNVYKKSTTAPRGGKSQPSEKESKETMGFVGSPDNRDDRDDRDDRRMRPSVAAGALATTDRASDERESRQLTSLLR